MEVGLQSKSWCGTVNNYSEIDEDMLKSLVDKGMATYLVYGHEVAPGTGTLHLQVYV